MSDHEYRGREARPGSRSGHRPPMGSVRLPRGFCRLRCLPMCLGEQTGEGAKQFVGLPHSLSTTLGFRGAGVASHRGQQSPPSASLWLTDAHCGFAASRRRGSGARVPPLQAVFRAICPRTGGAVPFLLPTPAVLGCRAPAGPWWPCMM